MGSKLRSKALFSTENSAQLKKCGGQRGRIQGTHEKGGSIGFNIPILVALLQQYLKTPEYELQRTHDSEERQADITDQAHAFLLTTDYLASSKPL